MSEKTSKRPDAPEKLTRAHDRTQFKSGANELDEWLHKYSWQNQRANNATTYVTAYQNRVVGYYAITVAAYERGGTPVAIAKQAPESVPCFLLARLAVDLEWRGQGIGYGLLRDAMRRVAVLSTSVAAPALLVHARDEPARDFYLSQAEFLQSPIEPLHLFLPMKTITAIFGTEG